MVVWCDHTVKPIELRGGVGKGILLSGASSSLSGGAQKISLDDLLCRPFCAIMERSTQFANLALSFRQAYPHVRSCPDSLCNWKEFEMRNIFVGNLSFRATEEAVRSMFEQYGVVERVNLITDRDTGQARGFGFVEMTNNAEADRAISELNGRELDGRALKVNEARPKTESAPGGGRRYGGGRSRNRW
jgi:cold-inducible RNA-binding protein